MLIDMDLLEAADRIARLHDDTPLKPAEAAVFIRQSTRTLERWRDPEHVGLGPDYIQARNGNITYLLGALKAWQRGSSINSIVANAIRQGQAFATLQDTFEPLPFWRTPAGLIGRVYDDTPDVFFEKIGIVEIVWIPQFEAIAIEQWDNADALKELAAKMTGLLSDARGALAAAVERAEIGVPPIMPPKPREGL